MDDQPEDDDRRYESWRHRRAAMPTQSYRAYRSRGDAAGGHWSTGRGIAATLSQPPQDDWSDDTQTPDLTGGADDWAQHYMPPMRSYRGSPHRFVATRGPFSGRGPRGYKRDDERIREDICEFLTDDGFVDAGDIEVIVQDGEVTLRGHVQGRDEKRRAEDLAVQIAGVVDVHNRLRLSDAR
jgi:hypothetical protein